jgi:hypothetical protein
MRLAPAALHLLFVGEVVDSLPAPIRIGLIVCNSLQANPAANCDHKNQLQVHLEILQSVAAVLEVVRSFEGLRQSSQPLLRNSGVAKWPKGLC